MIDFMLFFLFYSAASPSEVNSSSCDMFPCFFPWFILLLRLFIFLRRRLCHHIITESSPQAPPPPQPPQPCLTTATEGHHITNNTVTQHCKLSNKLEAMLQGKVKVSFLEQLKLNAELAVTSANVALKGQLGDEGQQKTIRFSTLSTSFLPTG